MAKPKSIILLSVVIPAFNEVENYKRGVLDQVAKFFKTQAYEWEVILVNDGSTDQTLKHLKDFAQKHPGFRVLDIVHGGKVAAVSAGVKEAKGQYVVFTDFDQSTPPTEIERLLSKLNSGFEVVIGNRANIKGWSFIQHLRSMIFNLLVQLIVLPGIKDSQCGFKGFKNEAAQKLFANLDVTYHTQKGGYMGAFDVELLYLARRLGYKIAQVKVDWIYFKSGRLSWSEPFKMLADVIKVKLHSLFGGYKHLEDKSKPSFSYHLPALILMVLLTFPAIKDTLTVGYFPMHDDLQMTRQLIMDKCFKDGQIPCRWSQDLGYGYGYPIFNFYPPLPYYFGQVFVWSGLHFNDTVKALVVLNFILSGLTMYLLAQAFWGRWGGLISGLMYIYAPYHSVDIYVRGAFNEASALVWLPAVFWALYKTITTNQWRYVPWVGLFVAFVMLSHNPILMIFAPGAVVWALFWLILSKNYKSIIKLGIGGVWALGLAAFFTLPVIFEQKYAHVETLVEGYFNYLAHFATFNELFFDTKWGYGDSRFGPIDDISFQVGYIHWIVALISVLVALIIRKKKPKTALMIVLMFGMTTFYTFMNHEKSSFIWSAIKSLEYLQFPWRFLTLSIFGTSFLAGSLWMVVGQVRQYWMKISFLIVFTGLIFTLYLGYFHWRDHWPWVSDQYKFSGELWRLQITSGIFDYLPVWAPMPPANPPDGDARVLDQHGQSQTIFKNSVKQDYKVTMQQPGVFQINTFYFPGWRYYVNGKEVTIDPYQDKELGRPDIYLQPGTYDIKAILTNTPIRQTGDTVSLIAWLTMLIYLALTLKSLSKHPAS